MASDPGQAYRSRGARAGVPFGPPRQSRRRSARPGDRGRGRGTPEGMAGQRRRTERSRRLGRDHRGRLAAALVQETDPKKKGVLSGLLTAMRTFSLEFGPKVSAELSAKRMKID